MSTRPRRLHTSATALALALSLSLPATAAAAPVTGKGSVLTLEGDDPAKAVALTKALQTEFAARGVGGGRDMSLSELKMTMGCDEPPSPKCLADGGRTLGVDNMVYGTLSKSGGGFVVQLNLLEIGTANVKESVTAEYPAGAFDAGQVQATAKDLVGRVLGPEQAATPADGGGEVGPEPEPQPQPSKSKLVWGRYNDVPTWKKAGLYASAGIAVVALGASLGLFLSWRKPNGPVYKKLMKFAEDSYTNDLDGDEVAYGEGENLCANARQPLGEGVTNADVANQCSRGEKLATATTGMLVLGGIALVSTIAFTTLLFVHKEKPGLAKLRQRGFNFGAAPTFSGGFMVGGGMRF